MAGELIELGRHKVYALKRGLGEPLLLVHGIYPGASHEEWSRNVAALASSFTVYAIDLLGFGESDAPKLTYTTQLYHHLLRDFIRTRIDAPVHLVAANESCAAATQLALFDDELVHRLVLVCPVEHPHQPTFTDRVNQFLYGRLPFGSGHYEAATENAALHEFLEERYAAADHIPHDRFERLRYNAMRPDSLWPYISLVTGFFDLSVYRPLRNVRRPVQVIWGESLGEPPTDQLLAPAAWSQGKRVDVIEGARHWPHDEQSARFNERVGEFLRAETLV